MNTESESPVSSLDPYDAKSRKDTPFDYIIVGSGAGGGPLAARLALGGKRVLLLEAGQDPSKEPSVEHPDAAPGEVHNIPGYHAASTEDSTASWQFSVRHYENDERQKADHKYDARRDPSAAEHDPSLPGSPRKGPGKAGVFYPRSSGIGGCTGHHAMIVAAPNDRDWETIADITGDNSWRAETMRSYFTKIENCLYIKTYTGALEKIFGPVYKALRKFYLLVLPRSILDQGGHGDDGWQPTSFIAPSLIERITKTDATFVRVLRKAVTSVVFRDRPLLKRWKDALFRFRLLKQFDINDRNTRGSGADGVFLIPLGIASKDQLDENDKPMTGRRAGVREFLLRTARDHPDNLVIKRGFHVTKLAYGETHDDGAAEVIGVHGCDGSYLYDASPLRPDERPEPENEVCLFAKSEVILCGGSFNTPQLLMLSGIGPKEELDRHNIDCRVDLPGVGRNLQDRYEITVISELSKEFKTLDGVSFIPGDPNDPARAEWNETGTGLYATNGGTLAITMRSSKADGPEPDLFTFGAPVAFRGYYWDWSRELLSRTKDAPKGPPNLWSWIILKAYTGNDGGQVTLRSNSPFDVPEIQFHSFEEHPLGDARAEALERDLNALHEGVEMVRSINSCNPELFQTEIQPSPDRPKDSSSLNDWIKGEAWGHHACGTCRMGSDTWTGDTSALVDRNAVLDSRFRVHGVRNLRVVDASVFPKIPGYFILTPTLMVSEKAADTILEEDSISSYPQQLADAEAKSVVERRERAQLGGNAAPETVGLAISGGGVRSATFSLGILQALARLNMLRQIDFMSTVSGGGFVGSFLGRLFTRSMVSDSSDPVDRAQQILTDPGSGPLGWLRSRANYIFASKSDRMANAGVIWRNLFTVHLVLIALLLGLFGALAGITDVLTQSKTFTMPWGNPEIVYTLSFWAWLPLVIAGLFLLPATFGYWLAPRSRICRTHAIIPYLVWVVLMLASCVAIAFPPVRLAGAVALVVLLLAWVMQEVARWSLPDNADEEEAGVIVRNRLSRMLGDLLGLLALSIGWVILDTLARTLATPGMAKILIISLFAISPILPMLRSVAENLSKKFEGIVSDLLLIIMSLLLGAFALLVINVAAHGIFIGDETLRGWFVVAVMLIFSLLISHGFDFLNLSSLHHAYAERLTRTYLGATNPNRIYDITTKEASPDVEQTHAEDDIAWDKYHPEQQGGPLHLVNICINETVDAASQLTVPDRHSLPMCVGPVGVSVGCRFHSLWHKPTLPPLWQRLMFKLEGRKAEDCHLPIGLDPLVSRKGAFHVLHRKKVPKSEVPLFWNGCISEDRENDVPLPESLSLGSWTAISGAAFSTGVGRETSFGRSFLLGFLNIRLGYWWDSGVRYEERPGRYPAGLWQIIKQLPSRVFRLQASLLSEWFGRYHGPNHRYWNLSDGGHFEVSGAYELIRRRVGLIIAIDATRDPDYTWESMGILSRTVRQDFGAEIEWLNPDKPEEIEAVPDWVIDRIKLSELGAISSIRGRDTKHAALARIRYAGSSKPSWLVVIKPSNSSDEPIDITNYAASSQKFPHDPTSDQVFDDAQWESYRALGEHIGRGLFKPQ